MKSMCLMNSLQAQKLKVCLKIQSAASQCSLSCCECQNCFSHSNYSSHGHDLQHNSVYNEQNPSELSHQPFLSDPAGLWMPSLLLSCALIPPQIEAMQGINLDNIFIKFQKLRKSYWLFLMNHMYRIIFPVSQQQCSL